MNMNEETKLFVEISKNLGEINTKLGSLCDTIAKHEQRLSVLEQNKISFKDNIIQWLVKGMIAAIFVISSLTGASGMIKTMFGL